ncbi:MAG TPA: glycosyltransferase family 39 protein [Chloroflexota bacterium]|nr:glycosyltransferase family 39 protein [Chloroflexota bacterium]
MTVVAPPAAAGAATPPPPTGESSPVTVRRIALLAALLLPVLAELWLRAASPRQIAVPGLAYVAACALFAALAGRAPDAVAAAGPGLSARRRALPAGLGLLVAALGIYLAYPEPRQSILLAPWLVGMALWIAAWGSVPKLGPTWRRDAALAVALAALALALRLYDLADLQPIQIDELVLTRPTLERSEDAATGRGFQLFAANRSDAFTHHRLTEYVRLFTFQRLGIDVFSLRLQSALLGVVEVVLVYFLGRTMFDWRAGLVAGATLATLTAHLTLTRNGVNNVEGSIVWTATAFFLARAFVRRSAASLALAGLPLAFALYVYHSARPAVGMTLAVLLFAALDRRVRGRWLALGALALVAGFVVGTGPMLAAYIKDPAIFTYKSQLTAWLAAAIDQFRATGDVAKLLPLWEHLRDSLLGYDVLTSIDNHYLPDRGLFLALPAGLLFGGLALATLRFLDWRHALLAFWFWAATLSLSALADVTPVVHRLMPALPAASLLIGLASARVLAAGERVRALRRLIAPAGALVLGAFLALEAAFYFGDYAHRDFDRWQDQMVRAVLAAEPGEHFALVPGPSPMGMELFVEGKPFAWASGLGRRTTGEDLGRVVDQLPDTGDRRLGVTYLVHSELAWWLEPIRAAYPGGTESRLLSTDERLPNRLAWLVYRVTPEQLDEKRGLDLRATDATGRTVERRLPSLAVDGAALPEDLAYPIDLQWRGWLRLPQRGGEPLRFSSTGSSGPLVRIGDQVADLAAARSAQIEGLPPGGHPLAATARLNSRSDRVAVTWEPRRGGEALDFPRGQAVAWPGPPRVSVEWMPQNGGAALRREYDVMIADNRLALRRPRDGRFLVRWSGTLQIEPAGPYEFEPAADGPVRLLLDGVQVWPTGGERLRRPEGPREQRRARVDLAAGRHELVLERDYFEGGQVTLLWRPPGAAEQRIVPIEAFAPLPWP